RLPANELKIDRGFVRELKQDTEDAAIVSAIVALGKALSLNVVAEGVETMSQQKLLAELGCNSLQGYLLGRPMTADDFMCAADGRLQAHCRLCMGCRAGQLSRGRREAKHRPAGHLATYCGDGSHHGRAPVRAGRAWHK